MTQPTPPHPTTDLAVTVVAADADFREVYAAGLRERAQQCRAAAEETDDPLAAAILRGCAVRDVLMARIAAPRRRTAR